MASEERIDGEATPCDGWLLDDPRKCVPRRAWRRSHVLRFAHFVGAWLTATIASGAPVDFVRDVRPIFERHCYGCHADKKQKSGLRLDIKRQAFQGGGLYGAGIIPMEPTKSPIVQVVADKDADLQMPPEGPRLSTVEIATLTRWVKEGATWPEGADRVAQADKRDHWSFKPIVRPAVPSSTSSWPRSPIDQWILARLQQAGLKPAPETDRVSWLRRVYFDLIGLPPTPEQVAAFVGDTGETAYVKVVDQLLASPHYGERWAQPWLDLVRYADTHGFEVNTERPHAWPYRDYVIRALNSDLPYDRFITEQIVGDAFFEDAATGFLVTASVLLPDQIGKDEPSKRLARQDSLDEIVNNIGQTFLGLSIGCARCHDHKFDPIEARDYYAMQAFIAGVEYLDRDVRSPEADAARTLSETLKKQRTAIDKQLAQMGPPAQSGAERPPVNATMNVDRFAPIKARRIRFTIRETNELEPCIDELEVYNTAGRNIAPASEGTIATSSGDIIVADRHDLKHINDGLYGNARAGCAACAAAVG